MSRIGCRQLVEWENDVLGEVQLKPEDINSEKIVNMYVYILGEELLSEFDLDQPADQLIEDLESNLSESAA